MITVEWSHSEEYSKALVTKPLSTPYKPQKKATELENVLKLIESADIVYK